MKEFKLALNFYLIKLFEIEKNKEIRNGWGEIY